ncbi:hypothetical protein Tco_1575869 [Tanacetum coccineum]
MPDLEDTADLLNTSIFSGAYDDKDVGVKASLNNLETTMNVSPISTTRIHKDHPKDQIIRDINSTTQTRRMTKISEELAMVSYIKRQRRTNHQDYQNYLFACFLSQIEPKKVTQALQDPRWIEAMHDELLQFILQKVWRLVDLPKGKHAIGTKWVYVDDIIFGSAKKSLCIEFEVKTASTPIETNKVLLNDEEAKDVFQVTPKTSHLHAVKRIFRYLKGQPKLDLWYPRYSPFNLEAFLIMIMLELALTENPQQEVVNFLANG